MSRTERGEGWRGGAHLGVHVEVGHDADFFLRQHRRQLLHLLPVRLQKLCLGSRKFALQPARATGVFLPACPSQPWHHPNMGKGAAQARSCRAVVQSTCHRDGACTWQTDIALHSWSATSILQRQLGNACEHRLEQQQTLRLGRGARARGGGGGGGLTPAP